MGGGSLVYGPTDVPGSQTVSDLKVSLDAARPFSIHETEANLFQGSQRLDDDNMALGTLSPDKEASSSGDGSSTAASIVLTVIWTPPQHPLRVMLMFAGTELA